MCICDSPSSNSLFFTFFSLVTLGAIHNGEFYMSGVAQYHMSWKVGKGRGRTLLSLCCSMRRRREELIWLCDCGSGCGIVYEDCNAVWSVKNIKEEEEGRTIMAV